MYLQSIKSVKHNAANSAKRSILKGHGNEADFLGFLHKPVRHRSLHYVSSCSDFSFEFSEIFVIEKRLPDSPSRGVDRIAYRYDFFQTFK